MSIKNPSLHDMKNFLDEGESLVHATQTSSSSSKSSETINSALDNMSLDQTGKESVNHQDVELFIEAAAEDASLSHYGVKGMKWGVRRTDEQLGKASSKSKSKSSSDGPGAISKAAKSVKDRVSKARQNRKEAQAEEAEAKAKATRLSADAERAIAASMKEPHQRSNQEMRDAINRANQIEQYNKLFGNDKAKMVADMRLEKEYRSLVKELTPEKKSSAQKAIAAATAGFSAYKALNDMSQGALNGAVMKKMGVKPKVDPLDQLTSATNLLKARAANIKAQQEVDRLTPKPKPKNPLITNKPYYSKSGEAHRAYARNAVKDAQDLNKILEDYLKE